MALSRTLSGAASVLTAFVFLLVPHECLSQARADQASPERQAKLGQRDELWRQAQSLSKEGKHEEAIRAGEQVLELETELFGRIHKETAGTLSWLVSENLSARRHDRAVEMAKINQEVSTQLHGGESWQAVSANYYLDYVTRLANQPAEVRDRLRDMEDQVIRLNESKQYREAARAAEKLAEEELPVLVEIHPFYANTLKHIADAYLAAGELAPAEAAARNCLAIRSETLRRGDAALPVAMALLGRILFRQKKFEEAHDLFQKAAPAYDEAGIPVNVAWMHSWQGSCWREQRQDETALASYSEAAARFETLKDDQGLAFTAGECGRCLYRLSRFRESLDRAAQAAAASQRINDAANTALALMLQGHCAREIGSSAQAVAFYDQTLTLQRRHFGEQHTECAATLNHLGNEEKRLKRYAEAERHFQEALEIRRAAFGEDHTDYLITLHNLASLFTARGDFARAEPLYQQAAKIAERIWSADDALYGQSLDHQAGFAFSIGDYDRALELYTQEIQILNRAGKDFETSYISALENLATVYRRKGDYAQAEPRLKEALEARRRRATKACLPCASTSQQLAALYTDMGDFAKAELLYRQALAMIKDAAGEESSRYVNGLVSLAWMDYQRRDFDAAVRHFEQALAIRKRLPDEKDERYADLVYGLGSAYEAKHDFTQAEPLVLEAMEIKQRVAGEDSLAFAYCLSCVQLLYTDMGEYEKAEAFCLNDLAIRKRILGENNHYYLKSLNNLARIYRYRGDYEKAEPLCRQVLQFSREHAERTAAVQSERQQLATERDLRQRLDGYLSLAVQAGRFDEAAYGHVLAWKGAVTNRQRAGRAIADRDDLQPLFAELQRASSRLATLALASPQAESVESRRQQLAELAAEVERLKQELAARSSDYRQARRQVALEDLRRVLPSDAVLIDYLEYTFTSGPTAPVGDGRTPAPPVKEPRLLAFVVRREGPVRLLDLGPAKEIETAVDAWRSDFGRTLRGAEAGVLLRQRVWDPVEQVLEETVAVPKSEAQLPKMVLVSPDGALGRLPMAALPGKESGSYLLEAWPIAVIAAPQTLPELLADEDTSTETKVANPQDLPGNMLALGGVDYDSASAEAADRPKKTFGRRAVRDASDSLFTELPGAKGEIASIEKTYREVFGDAGILTLQGAAATEESLRREAPRHLYLHLATHGFFAASKYRSALDADVSALEQLEGERSAQQTVAGYYPGLLSGIALAGANHPPAEGDDGILTAEEVATLNLSSAELAVLSACETGLGEVADGEGLLGLQRAFQVAGARTVVASFWKVPDAATRDLMERFYDNLWNRDMGKLEALREAQLWMLRDRGPRGLVELDEGDAAPQRLPPYYWAAFVLSGDWR